MNDCQAISIVRERFPDIDEEIFQYIEGVLSSTDDFESSDDIYEAIGGILEDILPNGNKEIRKLCDDIIGKFTITNGVSESNENKILDAPVQLSAKAAEMENKDEVIKSVWMVEREDVSKVDQKKLEKAEAKLRGKAEKRESDKKGTPPPIVMNMATASQVVSKKDRTLDSKGGANTKDIRIENFDVAFGERVLIQNATITLAFGRRYALVGRNGLGKTTLLRMISSKNLRIPSHISILHVEQEVTGDEVIALDSVLECDTKRADLLRREKDIQKRIQTGPDLLLLDEPTNMLDMKAIIWLENYLMGWPTTLLVVSHDRNFLDIVPTDILHLHTQTIDSYKGNYENFLTTRGERLKNQHREYESQMQFRAHVQEFIDKFRYNAKRASLVQSKIKMLEKLPVLKPVEKETTVTFRLPETEKLSPPILQLDEVDFAYSTDRLVFKKVDISASMESRICIVGENGAGKTTLLKILLGELEPTKGHRFCHRSLRIAYFTQHHVDQLDMRLSPVSLLQSKFSGKNVEEYRRQLGAFGVSGDLALQQLASLSGGQKSRVAFSIILLIIKMFYDDIVFYDLFLTIL
ncbi:ATP-binding cassette sub-family F member 3 [Armadillidium vulgare]|nr:ATP-binding cassette sub-family F member 3 [Armadillidium vulgare]